MTRLKKNRQRLPQGFQHCASQFDTHSF